MKWIETIKVQAAGGQERAIDKKLTILTNDLRKSTDSPGLQETVIYNHAAITGYFAIKLFWDTETPQNRGSALGLTLAQTVKSYGLVDHSVWVERESDA